MSFLTFITGSTRSWQPATTVDTTATSYWLNWRVLLCSIWILMSMVFASILIWKHECRPNSNTDERSSENGRRQEHEEGVGVLYEDEVWKPCLRSFHPGWLLGYRVFAFVVLLLMLVLNVVVDGWGIFLFYTQWTFTLSTIYFALGSFHSVRGCYRYNQIGADRHFDAESGSYGSSTTTQNSNVLNATKGMEIDRENHVRVKAGFLAYTFQIIFQMNAGAVMLTDTVFWFILVPFLVIKAYNLNFLIINMHSINAVFLLGETALNSLRFPWFRVGYFFLWTSVYVLFQWIVHARFSIWWPYPFLDLSSSYAPLWYSSVALMHIPCYGIFLLIMKAKHFLLSKWFPRSYRRVR